MVIYLIGVVVSFFVFLTLQIQMLKADNYEGYPISALVGLIVVSLLSWLGVGGSVVVLLIHWIVTLYEDGTFDKILFKFKYEE